MNRSELPMMKLDGAMLVLDYIQALPPKIAPQISKMALSLY
jgi:hypothetical protein